jgi:cellobiose-specific phosphotransferase system component IIA
MKRAILIGLLLVTACSAEPKPAEAPKAAKQVPESDAEDEVKTEKKSIEEAAEAATKLIEAEAREEIDALELAPTE